METVRNNLPLPISSFIGREGEIAEVHRLLVSLRLVTLTGAGRNGMTRLAAQIATNLVSAYADGVWLVEFAPLAARALLVQVVASVLGAREQPAQTLFGTPSPFFRPKQLLLLLDNCEHLIEACTALTHSLLQSCPATKNTRHQP